MGETLLECARIKRYAKPSEKRTSVKLFGLHLIWRKPRSTDIVIYDRVGAEFIRRCLDGIDNWQIMDVRDTLYVHPRVFFLSILLALWRATE